jgi:tRNA(Leu) C34 or U34 (ribose-2'-O)-methylase TrmL
MRGFAAIALVNPKSRENVGSALRAAGCYDASLVVIAGKRPEYYMGRIPTDTQKAYRHIPTFVHPERGYYIFGPEDGTLGVAITDRCKFKVQVSTKFCMNLAATVNVLLYDRLSKQERST